MSLDGVDIDSVYDHEKDAGYLKENKSKSPRTDFLKRKTNDSV